MWLNDQAVRLLKTKWKSAHALAEELYAIFTGEEPVTSNAPVAIDNPTPAAALTINNYTPGQSLFQVNGRNGQPVGTFRIVDGNLVFTSPPGPSFVGGNLNFGPAGTEASEASGTTPQGQNSGKPDKPKPQQQGGGAQAMPGQVQSGSGDTYLVNVYPDGLSAPAQTVTVKQLSIAEGKSILGQPWTLVSKTTDGKYYMQVPTWGATS